MTTFWVNLARRLWPAVEHLQGLDYTRAVGNIVTTLYAAPFALGGLIWLGAATDIESFQSHWALLLLFVGLLFIFDWLDFSLFVETTPGTYADWAWSFKGLVIWSVVFVVGPEALWVAWGWRVLMSASEWRRATLPDWRWNVVRDLVLDCALVVFGGMVAVTTYRAWGGQFPLRGLAWAAIGPALGAVLVGLLISALLWIPLLGFFAASRVYAWTPSPGVTFLRFLVITLGWRLLVDPLGVLAAALYTQAGTGGYLLFGAGLLVAAALAHQLSRALDRSRQRTRELEKLQALGQALLSTVPNRKELPAFLHRHVHGMFPFSHIELRYFPAETWIHHPKDWPLVGEAIWTWAAQAQDPRCFFPGDVTPWKERLVAKGIVITPVLDIETGEIVGSVYLARYRDLESLERLLPALQLFASHVATALQAARVWEQRLAYERLRQEFALAARIQSSLLPSHVPIIPGWQITAVLRPAQEVAGDFFDYFVLPDGRVGIIIADVSDKGLGAALYMSLSCTVLRIYAAQQPDPGQVLALTNARIMQDTRAGFFVTVFYGVLDPATGMLRYANGGHVPPLHLRSTGGKTVEALPRTGMALGVSASVQWETRVTTLEPGDALVLITDGVTDAENTELGFFGEVRLHIVLETQGGQTAESVRGVIEAALESFVAGAPQNDDLTVMVVSRQ